MGYNKNEGGIMKPLIDLVVEWHKTKSIETAYEICERLYKRMVWSEDDYDED